MKPVPPDTLGRKPTRQREGGGDVRLCMVEGGVEARDLRQCGVKLREGNDGGKVMGLMEWCQRNEAAQISGHRRVNTNRRGIDRSAMHHPMSGRDQSMLLKVAFQPAQNRSERILMC